MKKIILEQAISRFITASHKLHNHTLWRVESDRYTAHMRDRKKNLILHRIQMKRVLRVNGPPRVDIDINAKLRCHLHT